MGSIHRAFPTPVREELQAMGVPPAPRQYFKAKKGKHGFMEAPRPNGAYNRWKVKYAKEIEIARQRCQSRAMGFEN